MQTAEATRPAITMAGIRAKAEYWLSELTYLAGYDFDEDGAYIPVDITRAANELTGLLFDFNAAVLPEGWDRETRFSLLMDAAKAMTDVIGAGFSDRQHAADDARRSLSRFLLVAADLPAMRRAA